MAKTGYIAFDLGAESGRAMLAVLDNDKLELHEAHRFLNLPQRLPSGLHWDLLGLWSHLVAGLKKTAELAKSKKVKLVSLGVDTWGVDFALVGKSGQLLGVPYAYRDDRNAPAMKKAMRKLGAKRIYDATGIQFMPFNTLFQLIAQQDAEARTLIQAKHLLFMPDLLHYFFSGQAVNEATIASTSQMVNPKTGKWNKTLLTELGLPSSFLGRIVPAGSKIGKLRDDLAKDAGLDPIDVITPGGHDTASAVAAVPVDIKRSKPWAYLSSGTWSLMGLELDRPIVSDLACRMGFTNERGVADKIRFLKNIAGLWLVQEVRRDLAKKGQDLDYPALTQMAAKSEPFRTLVDPSHAPFASPGDMVRKLAEYAKATGQPEPKTPGQMVRACLESLALCYRATLDGLESISEQPIDVLHIVGGGGKNAILSQFTADAIDRPVIVGPFEGTAIGNALTQAIGAGQVKNLDHLRAIVRKSFDLVTYQPKQAAAFAQQRQRFEQLISPK